MTNYDKWEEFWFTIRFVAAMVAIVLIYYFWRAS